MLKNFISQWIPYVAGTFDLPDEQFERRDTLNNFWIDFFYKVYIQNSDQNVSKNENESEFESALLDNPQLFESDTRTISINKKLFVRAYRHQVYELLKNAKDKKDDPKELLKLQHKIEDWTLNFNENNMFITAPNVMSMLTKNSLPTAKEFLRGKFKLDKIVGRLEIIDEEKKKKAFLALRRNVINPYFLIVIQIC